VAPWLIAMHGLYGIGHAVNHNVATYVLSSKNQSQRMHSSPVQWIYQLEHSNSRFESIRFDPLCESIRIDSFSKKNRPFDSIVVMQLLH